VRENVQKGLIGKLRSITVHGTGSTLHSGTHWFDFIAWLAGRPQAVSGILHGPADKDVSSTAYIEFEDEVIGVSLGTSHAWPYYLEVCGEKGALALRRHMQIQWDLYLYSDRRPSPYFPPEMDVRPVEEVSPEQVMLGLSRGRCVTKFAVDEIVACLDENRESRVSSGEDGRTALEICLAIYESHRQGSRLVPLPLTNRKLRVASV